VEIAAVPATTSRYLVEEADYFHEITSNDWFTLETKKSSPRKKTTKPRKQATSEKK
jgi:hypothetical protein